MTHGLSKSERRNIAVLRMQCANYVHAHAGFKPSPLFQHGHLQYSERAGLYIDPLPIPAG